MKMKNAVTKIEQAQVAALKKRLASGKPLTAAQMAFVQRLAQTGVDNTGGGESDTAAGVSALARRLGVSRQVISWHRSRADAPKDFCVAAWRTYLLTQGKGATLGRIESPATSRGDSYAEIFGDGLLAAHGFSMENIGQFLEVALESAGVAASAEQIDRAAISLWLFTATAVHRVAMENGCPDSPLTDVEFDPNAPPEDNDWCPASIRATATRINFDLDAARREIFEVARCGAE